MKRIVIAMSFLSFFFRCGRGEPETPSGHETPGVAGTSSGRGAAEPVDGTILVRNGTPELVQEAIEAHVGLSGQEVPKEFRITIAEHANGSIVVRFPDGTTPYELVNLIGWLNAPPDIVGVSDARGWITSPSTGIRYSLKPEASNEMGDTLVGTSSDGKSVRVYLPDAALCEISQAVSTDPEPDFGSLTAENQVTFSVVIDVAADFGNHEFKITNPKDTSWSP